MAGAGGEIGGLAGGGSAPGVFRQGSGGDGTDPSHLIVLQPASVAAAARGYRSSRPLPEPVVIEAVFIDSSVASGSILVNIGQSSGAVAAQADAAAAQSIFGFEGETATSGVRQAVPVPNGTVVLGGLNIPVASPRARLWVEVINGHASDACLVSVTIQVRPIRDRRP